MEHKGMSQTGIIGLIALVIIVAGAVYYGAGMNRSNDDRMQGEDAMMEGDSDADTMTNGDTMMDDGKDAMMDDGDDVMMDDGTGDDAMMKGDTNSDVMIDTGSGEGAHMSFSGAVLAGSDAMPLLDFHEDDYTQVLASDKLIVLYFYANWCPVCRAEFPKMQAAFDALKGDGVIGFRVNYNDSETDTREQELARTHGVAYQHTKVFIKGGERILKSPEGWDQERYTVEINRYR